jgi:hypothetical protein
MSRREKQLFWTKALIMSSPNPKLNKVIVEVVKRFYDSDEVSRVMHGK